MSNASPIWLVFILALTAVAAAHAQTTKAGTTPVRYQLGDDARWADPDFDDSRWPIAEEGRVPSRSRDRDGFLWVRMRVPVEKGTQAPLAIHLSGLGGEPMAWQVYVNGLAVGGQGTFPPNAWPVLLPHSPVMNLPQALSLPGSTAVIAVREWYFPSPFTIESSSHPSVTIGSPSLLQLADETAGLHATLHTIPALAIHALLGVVGVFMLILWRRTGDRESFWSGLYLIATFNSIIGFVVAGSPHASWQTSIWAIALPHALNMPVSLEFVRALFRIRSRVFRWMGHIGWMLVQGGGMLSNFVPGSSIAVRIGTFAYFWGMMIFNGILLLACLREIYRGRGNRIVAAGLSLIYVVAILSINGIGLGGFFPTSQFLSVLAVGAMLTKRAWDSWKESNRLRVEVAAAREVQQVLVPADVPAIPGFQFQGVYKPAGEVGGDFFQVMPAGDGGTLVVIGDVSGKGIPAAMTVSLLVGTVRTLAHYTQSPGEILAAMNVRMQARSRGGFTTCLVIHVSQDGSLTAANAGHLAPYLNGKEVEIENGLPLGLAPNATYAESILLVEPGDQLMLITDGVVEARSHTGELLGFERTCALSVQPAEKVAEAAQAFGQEDDITVLTLKFAGVGVGVRG